MWMTFGRRGVLTDGVIDLRPFQGYPPLKSMRFGEMHDYRITLHGRHREIGQISVRLGEGTGIYYFGHNLINRMNYQADEDVQQYETLPEEAYADQTEGSGQ